MREENILECSKDMGLCMEVMKKRKRWLLFCFLTGAVVCIFGNAKLLYAQNTGNGPDTVYEYETEENKIPEIRFCAGKKEIKAGKTYKYKADIRNSKEKAVFESSNKKIAEITKNGKLTAHRMGAVWITASVGEARTRMRVRILPKKIITIDPGHSGNPARGKEPAGPGASEMKLKDSGGTCGVRTGVPEYKLTLRLATKLSRSLKKRGYQVVLTRSDNQTPVSNAERAQIANRAESDIFIRIHADGCDSAAVFGASAMYPSKNNPYVGNLSKRSRKLSECVLHAMCKKAGTKNRGSFARNDLTGNNWAKMPVTLIEAGFMTNPSEDCLLQQKQYQEKLAEGMADGIDNYFGF